MAIAFVRTFSGSHAFGTITVNVPAAGCAAGNHLILTWSVPDTGASLTSIADSKGNTYTIRTSTLLDDGSRCAEFADVYLTTALVSGDTITVTVPTGGAVDVAEFSGLAPSDYFDVETSQVQGSPVTTFDSGSTATTSQADELLIGFNVSNQATGSFTAADSFIEYADANWFTVTTLQAQYKIVSATGTYSSTATCASAAGLALIATYKAEDGGSFVPDRLSGPQQLTASAATIYTAAVPVIVDLISVSNPSGSAVDLTMSIGTDAAGTRLFDGLSIPADSQRDLRVHFVLGAAEIIQAFASSASVLDVTLNGRTV